MQRLIRGRLRGRIAAVLVVALAIGAVVAYAIAATGFPARHVELNDGGIWVTKDSAGLTGRLNKPIGQLDAGFYPPGGAQASFSVDVAQDGATVLAWDRGSGKLYPVDVALGAPITGDAVDLPNGFKLAVSAQTIATLDPKTGRVWAVRVAPDAPPTIAGLDPTLKETAKVGADADLVVTTAGTVIAVSGKEHRLLRLPVNGAGFAAASTTDLGATVVKPLVTAVGEQAVVLDRSGSRVLTPGSATIGLTGPGADAVIQTAGPAADVVYVGTPFNLQRLSLRGDPAVVVSSAGSGIPAQPTVLGGCVHAAWAGSPGIYARSCGTGPAQVLPLPAGSRLVRPVFRVNRHQIVLNDQETGTVYNVDGVPQRVDDWDAVKPPPTQQDDQNTERNPNSQSASSEDRAPKANADQVGIRAGRTNVLHLMDNDSDADGDILSIASVTTPTMTGADIVIAPDGQTVQVTVAAGAGGAFSFDYSINDGRGHQATAGVSVTLRPPSSDTAPELRPGYEARTGSAAANGTFEYPVLSDWRDADSDPLVLVSAKASAGIVTATPDGRVVLNAPGDPGLVTVDYSIEDGFGGQSASALTAQVQSADSPAIAPTAQPDVVRATVGTELPIHPLANDIAGSDPTDPDARIEISGPVAAPAGLAVETDTATGTVTITAAKAGTYLLNYGAFFGSSIVARGLIRVDAVDQASAAAIVAVPDSAVLHGQQATIADVLSNDFDPTGAVMVVQQAVASPADSGLEVAIIAGRWLRIVSREPAYTGLRTVRYTVQDGVSPPATGEVTVTQLPDPAVNTAPVAQDDQAVVRAGDSVTVAVLDNDLDPDGDSLQVVPGAATVSVGGGQAEVFGTSVRYSAPPSVTAVTQVIADYVITDPSGGRATGRISITVNPGVDAAHDQPPEPKPVEFGVVSGDTASITIPTTGVDPDGDSVTVIGIDSPPSLGRVLGYGANSIRYQAYPNATGLDRLTYVVQDRYGLVAKAIVRIGVVPAGAFQPPVAVNDTITAAPDTTVRVAILINDFQTPGDDVSVVPLTQTNTDLPAGTKLDDDHVSVVTPGLSARPVSVSYGLTDGLAPASVAQVVVRTQAGFNNPPVARDDDATVPKVGATATVDVLANDDDADGATSALTVEPPTDPSVSLVGGRLVVTLAAFPRNVPYTVRDAVGGSAIGVIHVPGLGGGLPSRRLDVDTIRLNQGQVRTVAVADYVTSPDGKALRLTTTDRLWASPGAGLSVVARGDRSLELHALGDYVGPAAVTFEVTDGASLDDPKGQKVVITVPVQIGPVTPVLRCPATPLTLVEGGAPLELNVVTLCHVWTQTPEDLASVDFTASWGTSIAGVRLAQRGDGNRIVTLTASGSTRPGTTGTVTVGARGTNASSTLNVTVIAAPKPTVAPITVEGGAGRERDIGRRSPVRVDADRAALGDRVVGPTQFRATRHRHSERPDDLDHSGRGQPRNDHFHLFGDRCVGS